MMFDLNNRVYAADKTAILDGKLRRYFHNPNKILPPFISSGMSVLDLGCGPGFFTQHAARLVGDTGKVVAADHKESMLHRVKSKIDKANLSTRVILHKCANSNICIQEKVDFILAFYITHEVPSKEKLLHELKSIMKPGGKLLLVEPKLFVNKYEFYQTELLAEKLGYNVVFRPSITLSRSLLLSVQ